MRRIQFSPTDVSARFDSKNRSTSAAQSVL